MKSCGETNKIKHFSLLGEDNLMKGSKVASVDMSKLEVEYDYDTESE